MTGMVTEYDYGPCSDVIKTASYSVGKAIGSLKNEGRSRSYG